jgi:hypothetical protein
MLKNLLEYCLYIKCGKCDTQFPIPASHIDALPQAFRQQFVKELLLGMGIKYERLSVYILTAFSI